VPASSPKTARIAVGVSALLGADATDPRIDQWVASLIDGYGVRPEDALDVPISGTPADAAERFAGYADAGATWLVLGTIGDDGHAQWKLIAQAAALLTDVRPSRQCARVRVDHRAAMRVPGQPLRNEPREPGKGRRCSFGFPTVQALAAEVWDRTPGRAVDRRVGGRGCAHGSLAASDHRP
jgi:hypothetical protein